MSRIWDILKKRRETLGKQEKSPESKDTSLDFIEIPTLEKIENAPILEEQANEETAPWLTSVESVRLFNVEPLARLHEELLDLVQWLHLDCVDTALRETVYQDIRELVHSNYKDAEVYVFGSYATQISLPNSDIDMMIDGIDGDIGLQKFASIIKSCGMSSYMEKITHARVPIIKFKHKKTGLMVDICFNQTSSLSTTLYLRDQLDTYIYLRPLVLIMKYMLYQRDLNETYGGGMGSFLTCMTVLAFLQYENREKTEDNSLGQKFLRLLNFYSYILNTDQVGITLLEGGGFFDKSEHGFENGKDGFMLCIENPTDVTLDVGKGCYRYNLIKVFFTHCLRTLVYNLSHADSVHSMLENIIQYKPRLEPSILYAPLYTQYKTYSNMPIVQSSLAIYTEMKDKDITTIHNNNNNNNNNKNNNNNTLESISKNSIHTIFDDDEEQKENEEEEITTIKEQSKSLTKKEKRKLDKEKRKLEAKKKKDIKDIKKKKLKQSNQSPNQEEDEEFMPTISNSNILINKNDIYNDEIEAEEMMNRIIEMEKEEANEKSMNSKDNHNDNQEKKKKKKKSKKNSNKNNKNIEIKDNSKESTIEDTNVIMPYDMNNNQLKQQNNQDNHQLISKDSSIKERNITSKKQNKKDKKKYQKKNRNVDIYIPDADSY
ncbi:hypothetical protein WA158_006455 [Blastocystis sp. Blastoise]